ncbi:MAG: winged helix-turn-helix transcriptional regulator [Planctomycetota bacterium]|jgi:DNA-binding MarR family transcriptional regulator
MNHQDLRTLQILEEIGNDHAPSQRELARKLNISLGLVNSFVKRLAHKGYFKVSTIPKNRVMYILTPKGAAEKTRLTYEYIQHSYQFYKRARQKLRDLFQELVEMEVRRIVFYGASDVAEIASVSLQETRIKLVAVVDTLRIGERFFGMVVKDPLVLESIPFDRILITAVGPKIDILKDLARRGIPRNKVLMLE